MVRSGLIPRFAAGLVLCASVGACSLFPDFSDTASIEVAQVRSLDQCNSAGPQPQVTLLPNAVALRAWEEARHVDFTGGGRLPAAGAYAVAEMGLHTSDGYAIAVSRRARLARDTVTLNATLLSPTSATVTADVVTSPCALVALPAGAVYRGVELRDGGGTLLARSHLPD